MNVLDRALIAWSQQDRARAIAFIDSQLSELSEEDPENYGPRALKESRMLFEFMLDNVKSGDDS